MQAAEAEAAQRHGKEMEVALAAVRAEAAAEKAAAVQAAKAEATRQSEAQGRDRSSGENRTEIHRAVGRGPWSFDQGLARPIQMSPAA